MKNFLVSATLLVATAGPASAEGKYDRSIEEAAARILAEKIGDIRGGFAPGEEPVFVPERRADIAESLVGAAKDWPKGLVRARDPLMAVSISF